MAIAPSMQESEDISGYIEASYLDNDRLYLVFSVNIDPDLPPLPSDLSVITDGRRVGVASLDLQLDGTQAVVVLLLETPLSPNSSFVVQYSPTQWLMCIEETGDAIEAFDEEILPQPIDSLDPELRSASHVESGVQGLQQAVKAKTIEANIRSASEYRIQLYINDGLDTTVPLEISDFRAELEDRWLKITSAKYINSTIDGSSEIRLELSEPMEQGGVVQVGYRSPSNRMRTLDAEPIAPFNVSSNVGRTLSHQIHDDEADLESVAVIQGAGLAALDELKIASREVTEQNLESKPDETEDAVAESEDTVAESEDTAAESEDTAAESEDIAAESEDIAAESEDIAAESEDIAEASEDIVSELEVEDLEGFSPEDMLEELDAISSDLIDEDALVETEISDVEAESTVAEQQEVTKPCDAVVSIAREVLSGATDDDHMPVEAAEMLSSPRAETITEKAARIQRALESKTVLPVTKQPLTLATKLIYVVPMVVFAWLLIVVCIYVSTIVFDLEFGASDDPVPINAIPSGMLHRETCSMKTADGSRYKGECLNGQREGQGVYTWATGNRYDGNWIAGERHGEGVMEYSSGAIYQGGYRAGLEHGIGTMAWPNGAVYEGGYSDGKFHGKGVYVSADGSRYEGVFEKGSMTQNGNCTKPGGETSPGPCGS